MCLWLLTACLGLLPSNPSPTNVIVVGVPAPIVQPTTTTARPNTTVSFPTIPTGTIPTITLPTVTFPTATFPTLPTVTIPTISPTGPLPIDPRLGTTPRPAAPAALQVPPITGYSAQIPNYDMSVRFPRQKRSLKNSLTNLFSGVDKMNGNHRISKRQSCACVPTGTCNRSGTNAGAGLIDIRIVTPGGGGTGQCPAGQEYCCTGTTAVVACGTRQGVPALAIAPQAGQASYGEFPWQALILSRQNDYLAGGVLIDQLNVLTVTHRLVNYIVSGTAPNVKVRLGEWDAAGAYEPLPFQEYTVTRAFTHPSYNPNTLQYGITVLRLASPVPLAPAAGSAPTINRACLPPSTASTYVGQRCWVSGWGKNMFGVTGQYQQILKKVDVPIVASATCQAQMQAARLGASFVLDTTSFICAGGEANKDSCTGDGGSGLVCQVNGQWVVVGLVSCGLGCASANVPAAYVNIAGLLPWIQQQVATP